MKQELEDLWMTYEEKISDNVKNVEDTQSQKRAELLKEVLSRKWMYSDVEDCKILITGINPSDDKDYTQTNFKFKKNVHTHTTIPLKKWLVV